MDTEFDSQRQSALNRTLRQCVDAALLYTSEASLRGAQLPQWKSKEGDRESVGFEVSPRVGRWE